MISWRRAQLADWNQSSTTKFQFRASSSLLCTLTDFFISSNNELLPASTYNHWMAKQKAKYNKKRFLRKKLEKTKKVFMKYSVHVTPSNKQWLNIQYLNQFRSKSAGRLYFNRANIYRANTLTAELSGSISVSIFYSLVKNVVR